MSWPKFSKVSCPTVTLSPRPPHPRSPPLLQDGASGFSFWAWLDGILGLLQEHLKLLWKDG